MLLGIRKVRFHKKGDEMKVFMRISLAVVIFAALGCFESVKRDMNTPVETVDFVALGDLTGLWYGIARMPFFFERNCTHTTVEYGLIDEQTISVTNTCRRNGETDAVEGQARVVDSNSNAKFKVRLGRFPGNLFDGDLWVLHIADDARWAVLGEPTGRYLWVISRTPQMPERTYERILALIEADGYFVEELIRVPQGG